MHIATTINTILNTAPRQDCVTKKPLIIGGVVHGTAIVAAGTNPHFVAKNAIVTLTIGVKINGTNKTGFNTIGKPNNNGSLILNNPGAADSLPTVLYC